MKCVLAITLLATAANAWDVTFYRNPRCTGSEVAQRTYDQTAKDTCITENIDNVSGAIVKNKGGAQSSISFYQGTACSGSALAVARDDGCVPFAIDGFSSVRLVSD